MSPSTAAPSLPSLDFLNTRATIQDLAQAVTLLFEPAPPIIQHLYAHRPYASYTGLIDETAVLLSNPERYFTREEQIDIINAHPRIGAAKANLSALSLIEQGYGGSTATTTTTTIKASVTTLASASAAVPAAPAVVDDAVTQATLKRLNEEYEARFGFKFVVFVNGRPRSVIIPVMEERIRCSDEPTEMWIAMRDMVAIARDRLKKLEESGSVGGDEGLKAKL